jgi:hypothetical protein
MFLFRVSKPTNHSIIYHFAPATRGVLFWCSKVHCRGETLQRLYCIFENLFTVEKDTFLVVFHHRWGGAAKRLRLSICQIGKPGEGILPLEVGPLCVLTLPKGLSLHSSQRLAVGNLNLNFPDDLFFICIKCISADL